MLSGDLSLTAEVAIDAGRGGASRGGLRALPTDPSDARLNRRERARGGPSFERSSVEWKLDGIRIQIHRRGDEMRIYTRNLNEITDTLPGIVDAVRRLPVTQAVLDGEALWMSERGPAAFQETVSQIDSAAPPEGIVTFLFDLLHVEGDDLLDTPLEERAARLEALAPQLRIPSVVTSDPETAQRVLDDSLRRRPRGDRGQGRRVALHRGAPRQGMAQGQAGADLRPGRARRRVGPRAPPGLALQPPPRRPRPADGRLPDGGKVLQGPDRRAPRVADEGVARARDRAGRGSRCSCARSSWSRSRLDGVQSSTRYPGGVALRFARVKRYRPDKSAEEADTIDDLRALLAQR